MVQERPLSGEEIDEIHSAIMQAMAPDDRYPYEVIRDTYREDAKAYYRAMAGWHNIPIGSARVVKKAVENLQKLSDKDNIAIEEVVFAIGDLRKDEFQLLFDALAKLDEYKKGNLEGVKELLKEIEKEHE